jgi:hypothetical protein
MSVARFFASATGRTLRGLVGLILLALGIFTWPYWVALIGALFVLVALLNVCILAPLFGGPFLGRDANGGKPTAPHTT